MNLFESIDLARKFGDGKVGIVESVTGREPDKTAVALNVSKRLQEAKIPDSEPVQLKSMPLAN